jgi:hypothetical protein
MTAQNFAVPNECNDGILIEILEETDFNAPADLIGDQISRQSFHPSCAIRGH